jgi:O-antigen ligase
MTQSRHLLSGIGDALTDPPDWATSYIFGGTCVIAAILFVVMATRGEASPAAVFALIVVALVVPWLVYWMLFFVFLAGAFALGAILHVTMFVGRAWRGEHLFDE